MRAVLCTKYGPPEVLRLMEVEKPVAKANEVCIRLHATTVTGSDVIVRSGQVSKKWMWFLMRLALGFTGPRARILGALVAGEIESVGKDVKRFQPGDAVFGVTIKTPTRPRMGTYAEYRCLPEDSVILPKPSNLTFEEAVAIPYGGLLALHFLQKGCIASGHKVLINGASGAVGSSAVQLARASGAEVTGVCSTANLGLVRSLGAEDVIDYTKQDCTLGDDRYDLVLDAVPASMSDRVGFHSKCQRILKSDGRHVSVDDGRPKMTTSALALLKELCEAGKLRPVIGRTYPLEQVAEAHRYVDTGHKVGSVVIAIR